MIVALTGSHSTGKSTLVEYFQDKKNIVRLSSVTRSTITNEERRVDGVVDLDVAQLKILLNIIQGIDNIIEMNEQNPDNIYLLDRCVFDFIAYSRCFYKQGKLSKCVLDVIEEKGSKLFQCIDLFGYLPIEFDIVDDGIRSLDNELRKEVDGEIVDLLKTNKVNYIVLSGSVDERIQNLQTRIDTFFSN